MPAGDLTPQAPRGQQDMPQAQGGLQTPTQPRDPQDMPQEPRDFQDVARATRDSQMPAQGMPHPTAACAQDPRRPSAFTILLPAAALAASAATVLVAALVGGRSYVVASVLVVVWCMLPFFAGFERSRPSAGELALLAALAALAVASRAAFVWFPGFKPMAAIVMLAGISLGPSRGFLVGAVAMLASNFLFGQGPWTPWQMLAFGLCGFVFGLPPVRRRAARRPWSLARRIAVSLGGAAFILVVAGPVLDTSSLFFMLSSITPPAAAAIYLAGLPVNAVHAAATFFTLLLAGDFLLRAIGRAKAKLAL